MCLQAAAVLGRPSAEDVDPDTEFGDLGFDSLTAVGYAAASNRATGLTLPPTVIFDVSTAVASMSPSKCLAAAQRNPVIRRRRLSNPPPRKYRSMPSPATASAGMAR